MEAAAAVVVVAAAAAAAAAASDLSRCVLLQWKLFCR